MRSKNQAEAAVVPTVARRVAAAGRAAQVELFNQNKKYAQGRELARVITERDSRNARAFVGLGEALMGLGQDQDAFSAFQKAAGIEPRNPRVVVENYTVMPTEQ